MFYIGPSRVKYSDLRGRPYYVNTKKYLIDWKGESASKYQFHIKQFLRQKWSRDKVCEEYPAHPLHPENKYRFDFINLDKKIVVEAHGAAHSRFNRYFHNTIDDFYASMDRDRKKELLCEKNGLKLVAIYHSTPLSFDWLAKRYQVKW